MSEEFKPNLSARQLFDVYLFLRATVKPKDMDETENLASLMKSFKLGIFRERISNLKKEGDIVKPDDFSSEAERIPVGSVDLKALIEKLKQLNGAVDLDMALRLRDVYDELVRARDYKPSETVAAP